MRKATQHAGISCTHGQNSSGLYRSSRNGNERKSYECREAGHLVREYHTGQNRMNPRNAPSNRNGNAAKISAGSYIQETSSRTKGRKNDPVVGKD